MHRHKVYTIKKYNGEHKLKVKKMHYQTPIGIGNFSSAWKTRHNLLVMLDTTLDILRVIKIITLLQWPVTQ